MYVFVIFLNIHKAPIHKELKELGEVIAPLRSAKKSGRMLLRYLISFV